MRIFTHHTGFAERETALLGTDDMIEFGSRYADMLVEVLILN